MNDDYCEEEDDGQILSQEIEWDESNMHIDPRKLIDPNFTPRLSITPPSNSKSVGDTNVQQQRKRPRRGERRRPLTHILGPPSEFDVLLEQISNANDTHNSHHKQQQQQKSWTQPNPSSHQNLDGVATDGDCGVAKKPTTSEDPFETAFGPAALLDTSTITAAVVNSKSATNEDSRPIANNNIKNNNPLSSTTDTTTTTPHRDTNAKPSNSPDFGDDFDMEDLDLMDSMVTQRGGQPPRNTNNPPLEPTTKPVAATHKSQPNARQPPQQAPTRKPNEATAPVPVIVEKDDKEKKEEDDPFGDLDFPDFDLEAIVEKAKSSRQRQTQQQPQQKLQQQATVSSSAMESSPLDGSEPKPQQHVTDENDDPFGDDIDFEEFDKAVARRSQSQTTSALAPEIVRNPRHETPLEHSYLSFSRYLVLHTRVDTVSPTFTKTLDVARWDNDMLDEEEQLKKALHRPHEWRKRNTKEWEVAGSIHLRGLWFHSEVEVGDTIHVCSLMGHFKTDVLPITLHDSPPEGSDRDDLVLVVHPDILLPPTNVSEFHGCPRRAVLKQRLGSTGLDSKHALFGTMRHSLFEETMRTKDFSVPTAKENIRNIVRRNAQGLVACNASSREAEEEITKAISLIQRFATVYTELDELAPKNRPFAKLDASRMSGNNSAPQFRAKSAESIEELFLSPELGLKGNVDMLTEAYTGRFNAFQKPPQPAMTAIELKTGKSHETHTFQLALYIMLLQSRYGTAAHNSTEVGSSDGGVLLYLNQEGMRMQAIHVAPLLHELKSLMGLRNGVAINQVKASRPRGIHLSYEEDTPSVVRARVDLVGNPATELPPVLPEAFTCKKCYSNRACMLYAATALSLTDSQREAIPQIDLLNHYTSHLGKEEYEYMQKWDRLIDFEADAQDSLIAKAWLLESSDRELKTSKTVSGLRFDPTLSSSDAVFDKSWYTHIALKRRETSLSQTPFTNVGIQKGNRAVLSLDSPSVSSNSSRPDVKLPRMHIVRATVNKVTPEHIVLLGSRDELKYVEDLVRSGGPNVAFRLDADETATGTGTLRQNVMNLMTGDKKAPSEAASQISETRLSRLRDILIRLRAPTYDENLTKELFNPLVGAIVSVPGCDLKGLAEEFEQLNPDQQAAARKVISAKDYTLIQGLPGTGKTSTIAFVARLLAAHGKRVLVTSYTHNAVDNVVIKLIESGVASTGEQRELPAVIRVGSRQKSHQQMIPILVDEAAARAEGHDLDIEGIHGLPSAETLKRVVSSARIVGVTALTVPRSELLVGQHFDVVIVDEAGQISQPAVIGALMAADAFVLVGDHMQLPPLVASELAGKGDYGVSMLRRLAEKHTDSIAQLSYQYRMHQDICNLSNAVAYGGRLKCANGEVATKKLELRCFPPKKQGTAAWLVQATDPSSAVVFLDTDKLRSNANPSHQFLERANGGQAGGSTNDTEVSLVRQTVGMFLACGLNASDIGVICPFRAQIRLLEECMSLSAWKRGGLEVSTIDRYQGRDKSVIVLSFVKSNDNGSVGKLLKDFRRINVAVTRAKYKLIMIGSYSTLYKGSEAMKPMLDLVRSKDQILELPENAI